MSLIARTYFALLLIGVTHRVLSISNLRLTVVSPPEDLARQFAVGLMGDAWVSCLLTLPVFLGLFLAKRRRPGLACSLAALWVTVWALMTAGHQSYTSFFKQQIIPFHLSYLIDPAFMSANGSSAFELRSTAILFAGVILALWVWQPPRPILRRRAFVEFIAIAVVSGALHAANIRWRVQWFVPENLQTHYLENLFRGFKTKRPLQRLSPDELTLLAEVAKKPAATDLGELLRPRTDAASPNLQNIARAVTERLKVGRRPVILLVVAETLRPADSGWTRKASDPVSLTPNLDNLQKSGVNFTNAYSTGPVTRGGQEAMWCSVPTGTDTSLMRSFPQAIVTCVPDLASKLGDTALWLHGGDARFDSQEAFWRRHQVSHFVLKQDFSEKAPRTGWGIGDLALMEKAGLEISNLQNSKEGRLITAMVLSVTNHIPWDLPSDAAAHIQNLKVTHPSHATTAYFDDSLGHLVAILKSDQTWEDTLLILASDHGNFEVPRNTSYAKGEADLYERLGSHINLVLSGGITESLRADGLLPETDESWASQAQVAGFIAAVSDYPLDGFFDVPLFSRSPWPLAVDLTQYLYLPQTKRKFAKEDVIGNHLQAPDPEATLATVRYRAYLQMLYETKPH